MLTSVIAQDGSKTTVASLGQTLLVRNLVVCASSAPWEIGGIGQSALQRVEVELGIGRAVLGIVETIMHTLCLSSATQMSVTQARHALCLSHLPW